MLIFGAMVILGTLAAVISRDLFDKLISLGIIVAGIMPFLADRGLLDVLTATALIAPLSTLPCPNGSKEEGGFNPEFVLGLTLILIGTIASAFPRPKTYLVQLSTWRYLRGASFL